MFGIRSAFQPYFLPTAVVMTEVTVEGVTGKTEDHPEVAEVAAEVVVVVGTLTMMTVTTAVMIGIVTVGGEVDTMMTMVVVAVVEEAEGEVIVEAEAEAEVEVEVEVEVEGAMVAIDMITVVVVEDMALQALQGLQRHPLIMVQAQLAMDHPLQ